MTIFRLFGERVEVFKDTDELVDSAAPLSDISALLVSRRSAPGDSAHVWNRQAQAVPVLPRGYAQEIQEEANRQDRSLSWVVQQAWKIARERIKSFPAVNDVAGAPDAREER